MKKLIVVLFCLTIALFLVWAGLYYYNRVYISGQNDLEWSQDIDTEDSIDDEIHWWGYEQEDEYKIARIVSRAVYENMSFMVTIEIKHFLNGHIEARFAQKGATGTQISLSDGESDSETIFTGHYDGFIRDGDNNEETAILIDNPNEFVTYLQQNPGCVVRYLLVGKGSTIPYELDLQHGERLKDLAEW